MAKTEKEVHMKRLPGFLLTITLIIGIIGLNGCATLKGEKAEAPMEKATLAPTVVVATPNVALDKKASVVVMGTGFKPGQEITLLFRDVNGVLSDIRSVLKPEPKVDDTGTWVTTWNASRYVSKKLIKEGAVVIQVADSEYKTLAVGLVNFYKPPKQEEKKK